VSGDPVDGGPGSGDGQASQEPPARLVSVVPDAEALARVTAARLVLALADAQAARGSASVVLTGGRIGAATLSEVAALPWRDVVDWAGVDVWWGDERFLPRGHADRNESQAREVLLDALPLDPARVHPVDGPDGPGGDDPDAAAARYADELLRNGPPAFDVVLLGLGEDGHVASLMPGTAGVTAAGWTTTVRDSPKPPPVRVSLTFDAIAAAEETWLVVSGADKAEPVAAALAGGRVEEVPAAGVRARRLVRWLLDAEAAFRLP
jgi:6-phosphogluconolactonase